MHKIFWLENIKGRNYSEDLDVSRMVMLEWILVKQSRKAWSGWM